MENVINNKKQIKVTILYLVVSIIWTFAIVLIAFIRCGGCYFGATDEIYISRTLKYYSTVQEYIHPLLSFLISKLSRFNFVGNIQIWAMFQICIIIIGSIIIHFFLLSFFYKSCKFATVAILIGIDVILILPYFASIRFTYTAIIALCICSILLVSKKYKKASSIYIVGDCCIILCFSIRPEVGYVATAFMVLCSAYALYDMENKYKKIICMICMYVGVVALLFLTRKISFITLYDDNNVEDFFESRVYFGDYGHVSFDGNEDIYNLAGWNKAVYDNAENVVYFLDEIDEKSLDYINSFWSEESFNIGNIWSSIMSSIRENVYLYCIFLLVVVISIYIFKTSRETKERLLVSLSVLFVLVMYIYLIINGRFPHRAIFSIFMPLIVIVLSLVMKNENTKNHIKNIFVCSFMLISVASIVYILSYYTDDAMLIRDYQNEDAKVITAYATEHDSNIYIWGEELFFDTDISNDSLYPANMISNRWLKNGEYKVINSYGIDKLNWDSMKNDNVYYIGRYNMCNEGIDVSQDFSQALLGYEYLESKDQVVGYIDVDHLGTITSDVTVYDYVFTDEQNDYPYWYYVDNGIVKKYINNNYQMSAQN